MSTLFRLLALRALAIAAFSGLIGASAAPPAERVEVSFPLQGRYADAGDGPLDAQAHQQVIAQHLQSLGERLLPRGAHLQIDVLEIDLAGRVIPDFRGGRAIRVLKGAADWPRIELRYVLTPSNGEPSSGHESLSDLTYMNQRMSVSADEPLSYEKRMLTAWFTSRFGTAPERGGLRSGG